MNVDTGEFRVLTVALAQAYDAGQDWFAYDLGTEIIAMIEDGATDEQIVRRVREIIGARMAVGLPREDWFEGDPW